MRRGVRHDATWINLSGADMSIECIQTGLQLQRHSV